jgi:hypothetical protein
MIFEVLATMKCQVMVFWVVIPCNNVGGYQHFGHFCRHLCPETEDGGRMASQARRLQPELRHRWEYNNEM